MLCIHGNDSLILFYNARGAECVSSRPTRRLTDHGLTSGKQRSNNVRGLGCAPRRIASSSAQWGHHGTCASAGYATLGRGEPPADAGRDPPTLPKVRAARIVAPMFPNDWLTIGLNAVGGGSIVSYQHNHRNGDITDGARKVE
jgi:hypothetical protein